MALRGLFSFDPLFTEDFFKLPLTPAAGELDPQVRFFRYYSQHEFFPPKFAVEKLVKELEAIAKKHGILDAKAAIGLEIFLSKFNYVKNSLKFNETALPLFTLGTTQLAEILAIIQKEEIWSDSRKTLIQHLMHNMNECPPGVLTHITDTRLALAADIPSQLMRFRRQLSEEMANRTLIKHDVRSGLGGDLEVPEDTDIHYVNGMLNLNHTELSIPSVPDEFAKYCAPTEAMSTEFTELVSLHLNAEYILQSFLDAEPEILTALKATSPLTMQVINKLSEWLLKFGTYQAKNKLIAEIATADTDDNYFLNPNINYYLLHALYHRLVNSNFLDGSKMKKHEIPNLGATFFIPPVGNIKLAYVQYEDPTLSNLPFVLYYYQLIRQEALDGKERTTSLHGLLHPTQLEALQEEMPNLIYNDWPLFIANHTPKEIEKFLQYVKKKFSLLALLPLIKKYKNEDNDERQALLERLALKASVLAANNINILFAYLDLFPREDWYRICTSDFVEMPLLQAPPLLSVINLLTLTPELSATDYLSNPNRLHAFIETADTLREHFPLLSYHDDFLKIFLAQENRQTWNLSKHFIGIYLQLENSLFDIFGQPKAYALLEALAAAKQHAAHLAEGIFTLYAESTPESALLNKTTLAFLQSHPKMAASIAKLLVIFQTSFKVQIDEALMAYLDKHLTEIELFFLITKHDPSLYNWLKYFIDQEMLNVESLKRLLERPELTTPIIDTLDALFQLSPELCRENANFIVANATHPGFLSSLRSIRERCKNRGVDAMQSGAPLMLLAALEGLVEVCKLLANNEVDPALSYEVKISFLQEAGYFQGKETELDKLIKEKLGEIEIDTETRITVTAKEVARLLKHDELVAFLTISEKDYSATHLKNFGWFKETMSRTDSTLQLDETPKLDQ